MPTPTYSFIAKATPTGSSLTFSSIPATYTDLVMLISSRITGAVNVSTIESRLNSTINSASGTYLEGTGSQAGGAQNSGNTIYIGYSPGANATANVFGSSEVYIPKYLTTTTKQVSAFMVAENNTTANYQNEVVLYANYSAVTAAVSSIYIIDTSGYNFASGTAFWLYGIKNS